MKPNKSQTAKYYLNERGQFIIENYNRAAVFSNFFPGIAGFWGIPMWVFYTNRGQCISSFGIEGKDKAIMEFQPANKAFRLTSLQGFRTFLKVKEGSKISFYEPFQDNLPNRCFELKHHMEITSHDLTIEETNVTLGLSIRVNYFTLPQEPFAALVRDVTIKNIGRKKATIELIDGMPVIVPYGLNDYLNKIIPRTAEAWNSVLNLDKGIPYFKLKVVISDRPLVHSIREGNFYFSLLVDQSKSRLLDPLVDPASVFGESSDFVVPQAFFQDSNFQIPKKQQTSNRSPCAMSFARLILAPKDERKIVSLIGHADSLKRVDQIFQKVSSKGFLEQKSKENKNIIEEIKNYCLTSSDLPAFDLYCGQTFLDNVLRGGLPISLETSEGKAVFNVYSRKHGDPERDYNHFVLSPTYLSQGNGNYRDINQNRRNDTWFNPEVKDSHVINFLNLVQVDGYNPLVVKGLLFSLSSPSKIDELLKKYVQGEGQEPIKELFAKGFQPGELLSLIEHHGIKLKTSPEEFLKETLSRCHKHELAVHGEGFWIDHWAYNLDLIERFWALYPEEKRSLLLDKKIFSFYHNTFHVLPRDQRYVLTDKGPRQYHSVVNFKGETAGDGFDHKLRSNSGKGPAYHTNLFVKLLCLAANKVATLDPSGIGIEMEADKPSWYDALNGLPGLLGSSICETFELKRLCLFLSQSMKDIGLKDQVEIQVFEELVNYISSLSNILMSETDALSYYQKSNDVKENYRRLTQHGLSGIEKGIPVSAVDRFLQMVIQKTDQAIELAKEKDGLYSTYFWHEVTEYEKLDKHNPDGLLHVRALKYKKHALPLFLEGFVHALRVEKDQNKARSLYQQVKKSPLFDSKLKMYRVNDDLSKESLEIGRANVFPPGWLENQSIWIHMEYKFLLELLRCGLYKEFYENFESTLIPFLDPAIYGRSILENSSFLASSAHSDQKLHGRGFVARLSGSTAEWLHIWLHMNMGEKPFYLDERGKLNLSFKPILSKELFTKKDTVIDFCNRDGHLKKIKLPKDTYAFKFLGSTLVVYHNPHRRDTFGPAKAAIKSITLIYPNQKNSTHISSDNISSEYAQDIRNRMVDRIDIYLN